jgi:hypothetical protein
MICLKTFANVFEAEVAARTLEAHGLAVRLSSDDGGRMIPSGFGGVQLFVEDADAERAVAILTAPEAGAAASTDQDVSVERQRHPGKRMITGLLWICGGVVVTVGTYKLTAPTGTFVIAYGAVAYGLYELGRGVVEAMSAADARATESQQDDSAS